MINQGENTNLDLQELLKRMNNMEKSIRTINKNSKKTIMSIDLLKEEIEDNKKQNFKLKKELETQKFLQVKIYKKILIILDQIDVLEKLANNFDMKELHNSIEIIKKIIRKEIADINLLEIRAENELFNSEIHRCVGIEENNEVNENEIISVIEKGYILNGKVLRPASVIISKKIKEEI